MDYYKYISEYLALPLKEVKDNAIILHKTSWSNNFIEQYNALGGEFIKGTVLILVPNDWFLFKLKHISEAHSKQKIILAQKDYILIEDKSASFIHNLAHIQQYHQIGESLFIKYRQEKVFKDLSITYPNNKFEYYAFSIQLKYLFSKGIAFSFFLDHMKQYSDEHEREVFFKRIIEHIKRKSLR